MRVCKNTRWVSRKRNRSESQTIGEGEKQQISSSKMKGNLENSRESAHSRENRVIKSPSLLSFHVHWLSFLYMLTMSCTRRFECALRLPQLLHFNQARDEIWNFFLRFLPLSHTRWMKITTTKVRSWVLASALLCHTHEISSLNDVRETVGTNDYDIFWIFLRLNFRSPTSRRNCQAIEISFDEHVTAHQIRIKVAKRTMKEIFRIFRISFWWLSSHPRLLPRRVCQRRRRKLKVSFFPLKIPPPVPYPAYCVILAKMLL